MYTGDSSRIVKNKQRCQAAVARNADTGAGQVILTPWGRLSSLRWQF